MPSGCEPVAYSECVEVRPGLVEVFTRILETQLALVLRHCRRDAVAVRTPGQAHRWVRRPMSQADTSRRADAGLPLQ